jgi:tungstate transport system substrate-binding protein
VLTIARSARSARSFLVLATTPVTLVILVILVILLTLTFSANSAAQGKFITLASTTSTQDSGLFKYLLPIFTKQSGIEVRVVAQGTGQAIAIAKRGDADLLLVHDKIAELQFIADGFGIDRQEVMYNDFVLIGPKSGTAGVVGSKDILNALQTIAQNKRLFVSRGDKSGTHAAELKFWAQLNIDPLSGKGSWYIEAGSGMGATLNTASAMNAYTIADRGTWLAFKNRGLLTIAVEGDKKLLNTYGLIRVNPEKHPHVKQELANQFSDWMTSSAGQKTIAEFKIQGEQVFFPNLEK